MATATAPVARARFTGTGDDLNIELADGDDTVVLTNNSFTINGGGGPVAGRHGHRLPAVHGGSRFLPTWRVVAHVVR